jgi:hypothetical protein
MEAWTSAKAVGQSPERTAMALPDPEIALKLARGVSRFLENLGYGTLTEFSLATGRRADVFGVNERGETVIVEIKSSAVDFLTDNKWPEYREFCDYFYFAVALDFPREILPAECGLIIADAYSAEILRASDLVSLNASRRKALLLRFALTASMRLRRLMDPDL